MQYRIAVVEDHLLQRVSTVSLIDRQPDMKTVVATETLPDLMEWISAAPSSRRPHLVLLDIMVERQPNAKPETVKELIASGCRVMLFSALASRPLVRKMIHAGVHGVIGKRDGEQRILQALRTVLEGRPWMSPELAAVIAHDPNRPELSDQEERVLVLYSSGLTVEAVAAAIGVKPNTAKKYLQRVKAKYASAQRPHGTRTELMRAAYDDGYFELTA